MQIGPYLIDPPVVLAPMAGVTDKPFRLLCKRLGAGLAVSEMTTADPKLWHTRKSLHRMDHSGEPEPVSVQIAGADPVVLAEAARFNVANGAQIVDIATYTLHKVMVTARQTAFFMGFGNFTTCHQF
jgi:tRNA-dihydrouridine synthase B